jgi:hypothetical protein
VADIGDPAAMEFRALCTQHQVQNLQWDFSAFSKETIDDPCVNLQAGGTADYRLGYSYNEGFRALQNHSVDRQRYVYALLADVFEQPCLYADVLFTRQELWKSAKVPIGKIVNKILESYKYFLDTTEPDRLRHEEINRLMTENCREWWLDLTQGKHFDRPASKLIEQLAESWGRKREQHKRGDPDAWRELEKRVLLDTGADPDIAPYYEWIRGLGES